MIFGRFSSCFLITLILTFSSFLIPSFQNIDAQISSTSKNPITNLSTSNCDGSVSPLAASPSISSKFGNGSPITDSYIHITSASLNGIKYDPSCKSIQVNPHSQITGSLDISTYNSGPGFAVYVMGTTPTWGDHASSFWSVGSYPPGQSTATITIDVTAPSTPGTYYLIVAGRWELAASQVMSGTNWAVGHLDWNQGHDVAGWNDTQIYWARSNGLTVGPVEGQTGTTENYIPADALKIIVAETDNNAGTLSTTTPITPTNNAIIQSQSSPSILPSGIVHSVALTMTNNQPISTPSPFQQMIEVDSSYYAQFEAPNLQNVEFFYQDGTIIPSWLESGDNSGSTNTIYWLKLASGMPANSDMTIYMGFASTSTNLFNGQSIGEAPQLSQVYGQYDDGNTVFNFYDNFAGSSLDTNKWNSYGSNGVSKSTSDIVVNDGLTIKGNPGVFWQNANWVGSTINEVQFTKPMIFEVYSNVDVQNIGKTNARIGFTDLYPMNFASVPGGSGGNGGGFAGGSNDPTILYLATISSGEYNYGMMNFLKSQLNKLNVYSIHATNSQFSSNVDYSSTQVNTKDVPSYSSSVGLIMENNYQPTDNFYQWFRIRAVPPNDLMPTINGIAIGNISTSTTPQSSSSSQNCITLSDNQLTGNPQGQPIYSPNQLSLDSGISQFNLWNAVSASGSIQQCYDKNTGLKTSINLNNIQYYSYSGAPAAYSEIGYGTSLNGVPFGNQNTALTFPVDVNSFENLNYQASVNYEFGIPIPSNLPVDFTYDLWIRQPCQDTSNSFSCDIQSKDYEIMIWLYNSNNNALGTKVNNTPITIDQLSWNEFKGTGSAGATTISFVLTTPKSNGNISLNLGDFIKTSGNIVNNDFSGYSLMGVELGTEFGKNNQFTNADWTWEITNFNLSNSINTIPIVSTMNSGTSSSQTISTTSTQSQINQPTLSLKPDHANGYDAVSFTTSGFNTDVSIQLFWEDGSIAGLTVPPSPTGVFVVIPVQGIHTLTAHGKCGIMPSLQDCSASATLTVVSVPNLLTGNPTPPSLPIITHPISGSTTTPILIGIKNLVTLNPFGISKVSGSCPSSLLGVTLVNCFSIQQNFFINIPGQTNTVYWAQNVIQVGTDNKGNTYAAPGYYISTPDGKLITANYEKLETFHQITTPITFDIESTISNNQLYMKNNYATNSYQLPQGSYININNNICNSNSPPVPQDESPQLDIVGPQKGEYTYFSSGGGQVQSYIMLAGQSQWSDNIIQQALNNFGCENTLEESYNLQWTTNDNVNLASFSTVQGINDQGVGFIPSTSSVKSSPASSNQNSSTSTSSQQTQQSFSVSFVESGLQQSCWFWIFGCSLPSWSVTLDGNTQTSTSTSIIFDSINSGTYSYSVNTPSGYSAPSTNQLQVNGNVNQPIIFVKNS